MIRFPSPVIDARDRGVIPFVTLREGEEAAPADLHLLPYGLSGPRLVYGDEDLRDRPLRDILWARCSFSMGEGGMPTGEPRWKFLHPYRQMATMLAMRCQICAQQARTPLGWIFLAGPKDQEPSETTVWMAQPPVCARHVRMVERLCPHMEGTPTVFLAASAPLYGVLGSVYGHGPGGTVDVVERPEGPVRFGDPRAPRVLASQLVRRLSSFRVLTVDELHAGLRAAA